MINALQSGNDIVSGLRAIGRLPSLTFTGAKDGVKAVAFHRDFVAWIDFLKNGWMGFGTAEAVPFQSMDG
jgi:hypothetical protein